MFAQTRLDSSDGTTHKDYQYMRHSNGSCGSCRRRKGFVDVDVSVLRHHERKMNAADQAFLDGMGQYVRRYPLASAAGDVAGRHAHHASPSEFSANDS